VVLAGNREVSRPRSAKERSEGVWFESNSAHYEKMSAFRQAFFIYEVGWFEPTHFLCLFWISFSKYLIARFASAFRAEEVPLPSSLFLASRACLSWLMVRFFQNMLMSHSSRIWWKPKGFRYCNGGLQASRIFGFTRLQRVIGIFKENLISLFLVWQNSVVA